MFGQHGCQRAFAHANITLNRYVPVRRHKGAKDKFL
jgi:hypothetical protein